jgi:DNA-binding protein H-NS
MTKLIDLQSQIEKLQKQASEIRSKEFDATVAEILQLMNAYGITLKDLQAPKSKTKAGRPAKSVGAKPVKIKKEKKEKSAVAAKYKGPNGETWSGRGLTPKWLASLIASGQSKESFLIVDAAQIASTEDAPQS